MGLAGGWDPVGVPVGIPRQLHPTQPKGNHQASASIRSIALRALLAVGSGTRTS